MVTPLRGVLVALALTACASAEAPAPTIWSFEADTQGWQPRTAAIKLERAAGTGATAESKGSLHFAGTLNAGWNYVTSPRCPLTAKQAYRLSAWLRVDAIGAATPPPFLKLEFVPATGAELGRVGTDPVDPRQLKVWQKVEVEFVAPAGAVAGWVAVEKGTDQSATLDAYLDDVRVEPIDKLRSLEAYQLDPVPAPLAARKGVHPRLYLDAAGVARLREAVQTTHAALWEAVRKQADRDVAAPVPAYRDKPDGSGEEQLWQREVGNQMGYLAMAWLVSGDRKYLTAAQAWALASCGYPTWGLGGLDGKDLASGHQLLGLALVYDWCFADLDPAARQTIRETLVRRGGAMFGYASSGQVGWSRAYLQNHLWVNACGLAAAGLAIWDEVPEALQWPAFTLAKVKRTTALLGPDGASHEGVGYHQYGVEYLLKFMHLARELLAVDLHDTPWWRQTALYELYLTIPRNVWSGSNCLVDIADCPRGNWYGPDYLLRALAHEYHDGHAQWLAQETDTRKTAVGGAGWLNLLWYDPSVPATPPADLPTMHHFDDLDIVSARTDWSGDESLVVLKCGPPLGHEATAKLQADAGSGHVHPDAGHFLVFGGGEWLVCDDGYQPKFTAQHNTLLVDGRGQYGEGQMWLNGGEALRAKSDPRITLARSIPALDHFVAEPAAAYPPERGLKSWVRHLLWLKPNTLLVLDDLATDQPRDLELRIHTERDLSDAAAGAYLAKGPKAALRLEPLTADGVTVTAGKDSFKGRYEARPLVMNTLAMKTRRAAWRNAVALTWSALPAEPAKVTLAAQGDVWTFKVGERTVVFDWAKGDVR